MKTPYVTVQFASRTVPGMYGGREYTYIADKCLEVGDIVFLDTRFGGSLGKVTAINVDERTIAPKVRPLLKHITGDAIDPAKLPQPAAQNEARQISLGEVKSE